MRDLQTASQGSSEPEAGWFDLFSSRYWKGIPEFKTNSFIIYGQSFLVYLSRNSVVTKCY